MVASDMAQLKKQVAKKVAQSKRAARIRWTIAKAKSFSTSLLNIGTRRSVRIKREKMPVMGKAVIEATTPDLKEVGRSPLFIHTVKPIKKSIFPKQISRRTRSKVGKAVRTIRTLVKPPPLKRTVATSVQRPTKPIQRRRSTQTLATLSRKTMR